MFIASVLATSNPSSYPSIEVRTGRVVPSIPVRTSVSPGKADVFVSSRLKFGSFTAGQVSDNKVKGKLKDWKEHGKTVKISKERNAQRSLSRANSALQALSEKMTRSQNRLGRTSSKIETQSNVVAEVEQAQIEAGYQTYYTDEHASLAQLQKDYAEESAKLDQLEKDYAEARREYRKAEKEYGQVQREITAGRIAENIQNKLKEMTPYHILAAQDSGGTVRSVCLLNLNKYPETPETYAYVEELVADSKPKAKGAGLVALQEAERYAKNKGFAYMCLSTCDPPVKEYYIGHGYIKDENSTVLFTKTL
jgi:hypothetical protein